ncbi:MAG: glycosyltransferase, partial [Bacteroidetes bacterium]|nr:glycosyltransferase [Bacteroidota bacterium]
MVDVSIIIVNYNVRYFIEQAILSIKEASSNLVIEIIVIDNASQDDSVEMLQKKFPEITLIANQENVGFGRANNQGISIAKGKYLLLLNPDTLVQNNTLQVCIDFMEKTKDCGAIGVKMIDGKGNFLPESKRSIPTPSVALYKMLGLSSLFPKSKVFGKYHLAYLDQNENHQVEVLSGAFMFFRADLLQKIGGFDEDYFMYGEDIDLSYQVLKNGYKNYYLADTSIIHYKGESTKKGSLNYVKVFYEAMLIFAKKHYSPNQAKLYSFIIYFAIFIKGGLTLLNNYFKQSLMTILDFTTSYLGIFGIAFLYGLEVKGSAAYYPKEFFIYVLPFYVLVWILSGALSGIYDKAYKTKAIWKGVLIGTLVIAAIYGFFPEKLRYSRAIILLGGAFTILTMHAHRFLYHFIWHKKAVFQLNDKTKLAIVGNESESQRALSLLNESAENVEFVGFINYDGSFQSDPLLGDFLNLKDIVSLYKIEELIF